MYNRLQEFIRGEYRARGYQEVVTPNMYNLDLWVTSGHAANYKENMFLFDVEKQQFGLKPMNCPGHCLLFDHRVRSYRGQQPRRFSRNHMALKNTTVSSRYLGKCVSLSVSTRSLVLRFGLAEPEGMKRRS